MCEINCILNVVVVVWNGWLSSNYNLQGGHHSVLKIWQFRFIRTLFWTDWTGKCAYNASFNFSNRISKVNIKRPLPYMKHKYHSLMHFDTSSQIEYFWLQITCQQLSDTQYCNISLNLNCTQELHVSYPSITKKIHCVQQNAFKISLLNSVPKTITSVSNSPS